MPRKPNPPPDDAAQAARFIEAAKQIDADKAGKAGKAFTRALDTLIPTPRPGTKTKKKRR